MGKIKKDLTRQVLDGLTITDAVARKQIKVDFCGHLCQLDFVVLVNCPSFEQVRRLNRAIDERKPLEQFITIGASLLCRCGYCGKRPVFETNGRILRPKISCVYENGLPLEFELNVPSGVLIVADDLRPHFDITREYDVNTPIGCAKTSHAMAKIGCAHAFVGNSCPEVYRQSDGTMIVASNGWKETAKKEIKPKGRRVASIRTNLWWYSMVDGDEFAHRGCEGKYEVDRVTVKPGVYRFTHYRHLKSFFNNDYTRVTVYSKIEWLRRPDPVKRTGKGTIRSARFS